MKMQEDPPAVISHDAHRAHKLRLVTTAGGPPFRCDGCKEPGSGTGRRYRCGDGCEFDLHICCALPEATLKHSLLGDLKFSLEEATAFDAAAVACAACGVEAGGLVYHCSDFKKDKDHLYLHPCCAALKAETVLEDGHRVQLCVEAKVRCVVCNEKKERRQHIFSSRRKLWAYRWFYGGEEGYLHVSCMNKIAVQSWEQACDLDGGGAVLEASVPIMKGILMRQRLTGEKGSAASDVQVVANEIGLVGNVIGLASNVAQAGNN